MNVENSPSNLLQKSSLTEVDVFKKTDFLYRYDIKITSCWHFAEVEFKIIKLLKSENITIIFKNFDELSGVLTSTEINNDIATKIKNIHKCNNDHFKIEFIFQGKYPVKDCQIEFTLKNMKVDHTICGHQDNKTVKFPLVGCSKVEYSCTDYDHDPLNWGKGRWDGLKKKSPLARAEGTRLMAGCFGYPCEVILNANIIFLNYSPKVIVCHLGSGWSDPKLIKMAGPVGTHACRSTTMLEMCHDMCTECYHNRLNSRNNLPRGFSSGFVSLYCHNNTLKELPE